MQVHFHPSGLFQQQRCTLENWNSLSYDHANDLNPRSERNGIRCYHFLTSLILRLFGLIHIEKTADGKSVYLNKKSFTKWKEWRGFEEKPFASSSNKTEKVADKVLPKVFDEPIDIDQSENELDLNEAGQAFLQKISDECTSDISRTWRALLSNIPPHLVTGFNTDKKGQYTLSFSRPVTLWLNSRSRSGRHTYPKGGTVILLGHNKNNTLTFTTHQNIRTIKFQTGMNFWCNTPLGIRMVDVVRMKDLDSDNIELEAGCKVGYGFARIFKSKNEQHPKARFERVWSEATILDEKESYSDYLKQKIASESP